MQHAQVVQDHLVEQYLLDEMTAPVRDEFEEHFFECRECADDLKATAAFLQTTRDELKREHQQEVAAAAQPRALKGSQPANKWWQNLWVPALTLSALAACLLVIAYQNIAVYPKLNNEVALLQSPEVVPTLSLIGAASRGGETPALSVSKAHALLLQVDIPGQPNFTSYTCLIYSPSQKLIGSVQVLPQQAKDTVNIRVPVRAGEYGSYSLVVHGNDAAGGSSPGVDLAHYTFQVNSGSAGSEH